MKTSRHVRALSLLVLVVAVELTLMASAGTTANKDGDLKMAAYGEPGLVPPEGAGSK